jgi:hypothetical protein
MLTHNLGTGFSWRVVVVTSVLLAAVWTTGIAAVPTAGSTADTTSSTNPSTANAQGSKTYTPVVAGDALSVDDLHIGTTCDPRTGAISGSVPTRQLKGAGDVFTVYFDSSKLQNAKIDEKERNTRLYDDIQAVLASVAAAAPSCDQERVSKTLKFERGTVKVTGVDPQGNDASSVTVVTGPAEHAYLGLDLTVTNRNTLKYDTASKTLQPASTSPQFYLSLNWLVGDILSPAEPLNHFYKNFSAKVFVTASSTPLNSYGAGLGYRLPELKLGGFNLSDLNVYGGYFWTKQDSTSASGTVQTNGGTNKGWRLGVTYDVGSALKYVKW